MFWGGGTRRPPGAEPGYLVSECFPSSARPATRATGRSAHPNGTYRSTCIRHTDTPLSDIRHTRVRPIAQVTRQHAQLRTPSHALGTGEDPDPAPLACRTWGLWHWIRPRLTPSKLCVTPETQWQSRGKWRILQGCNWKSVMPIQKRTKIDSLIIIRALPRLRAQKRSEKLTFLSPKLRFLRSDRRRRAAARAQPGPFD
jgi:hypothetical protein